jgi:hypothetical protein
MSFSPRDIRPGMDVYTLDNRYLGPVLKVIAGTPDAQEPLPPRTFQSSHISGEGLGPMPTQSLGNTGPRAQSAAACYGIGADAGETLGQGTIVVGKWWGLRERQTIAISAIQTVSLERIVLKW